MHLMAIVFSLLTLLAAVAFGPSLLAQESPQVPIPARGDNQTQIVTDEQAGVVRVLIKGREVLVIDENGLTVQGNIAYSGNITDTNGSTGHAP